jgi:hypothetical protein
MLACRVGLLSVVTALALVVGVPSLSTGGVVVITRTASPADGSAAAMRTATVLALARALEEARARGLTRATPVHVDARWDGVTVQIVASGEDGLEPGARVLDLTDRGTSTAP